MLEPEETEAPVLLITIGGAGLGRLHPLLDAGTLPHINSLVDEGVLAPLRAPLPSVGPMLWTSLVTGHTAAVHGIGGSRVPHGRLLIDADRRCPALWDIAAAKGRSACVVGGWATHGAADGSVMRVSEHFGSPAIGKSDGFLAAAVHPAEVREPIADCWVRPEEVDLDTLAWFVPEWRQVDQDRDPRLAIVADALAYTLSRHASFTWILENHRPALTVVDYPLLDMLLPVFLPHNASDADAPGKAGGDAADEGSPYDQVVARGYALADLLIGRLAELAGPQVRIILASTHGYVSAATATAPNAERPSAATTLDGSGFLICAGPGVERDALIHGATILDVTPTMLGMLNLPIANDMPGRVLGEILPVEEMSGESVPSWSHVRSHSDPENMLEPTSGAPISEPAQLATLIRGLSSSALPESDRIWPGAGSADQNAATEWSWNLARARVRGGAAAEALPDLEDIVEHYPQRIDFQLELVQCQLQLGLVREARERTLEIQEHVPESPLVQIVLARCEQAAGRFSESLEHLRKASELDGGNPVLNLSLGLALLHLHRWKDALSAYDAVLREKPSDTDALRGRTRALLGLRRFPEAAQTAIEAIGEDYQQPACSFHVGHRFAGARYESGGHNQPGECDPASP